MLIHRNPDNSLRLYTPKEAMQLFGISIQSDTLLAFGETKSPLGECCVAYKAISRTMLEYAEDRETILRLAENAIQKQLEAIS